MIRNVLGSLMGLVGAAAALWSPYRAWYEGRRGRDYRVEELFAGSGITPDGAALLGSLMLPFLCAALLALAAAVLRSRLLMALAGIVVLGFSVLWMVRQGQAAGSLSVGGDGQGLGNGVATAFAGGALILLGAFVMRGRPRRDRRPLPRDAGMPGAVTGWEDRPVTPRTEPWHPDDHPRDTGPQDPRDPRRDARPQYPDPQAPGPHDPGPQYPGAHDPGQQYPNPQDPGPQGPGPQAPGPHDPRA
ncbi:MULTISPECIES: hypothetical protein [unclassified Streptomyces]|uniref:hypothetical protein n=1 Tax=unclassified Streptomyces TaxID=2593676 RepID=UPI002481EA11|nr:MULTISPECIES: hypothetical protein [unclassified Streptomyces]MDA5284225.1 hypothetical protein [Streptomyces sp. Isolate_45]MDX2392463.1 hypothetical protein [Streptomyces sp. DK15]